jgi:hypothetical protein
MANSTMLAILFFALVPCFASAADESCAVAGNCLESVEFDTDGGLTLLQRKADKQLKAEAVAQEGLKLTQAMKMYAKTHNDITSEGAKALAHLRWGIGFMKSVCSMLEAAPAESSLLQGVKSLVGISKLQEDYAQMCETVITGENACASRADIVVNLHACPTSGTAAGCTTASAFAQTLASDAKALSDYAFCASTSAQNDLQAFNSFLDGASGLGSGCIGVCQWLKSFSVDTKPLQSALVDFAAIAGEANNIHDGVKALDPPTAGSLAPYAKQLQDVVDDLDKVESTLMLAESDNCKAGAGKLSMLPSSLTSTASSLMSDCSSNCAHFAAMLGR